VLRLCVIAWLVVLATPARADSVALLPLDGEKRLEIYGQPVAAELARALNGAGVEVVVVGAKMAVPAQAKLIVDGNIKAKGQSVTLELRIRDAKDGATLERLPPSSGQLMNIDKVAAEASAKVVPAVKTELEELAKKAAAAAATNDNPPDKQPDRPVVPTGPTIPVLVVAVSASGNAGPAALQLQNALRTESQSWAREHAHTANVIEPALVVNKNAAPGAVESAGGEFGIALDVLAVQLWPGRIPMARARVRLRVISRDGFRFDRVIHTDTIVGDRQISEAEFSARVAREVLSIAHPNIRRTMSTWK
jgi:hypothetical protein